MYEEIHTFICWECSTVFSINCITLLWSCYHWVMSFFLIFRGPKAKLGWKIKLFSCVCFKHKCIVLCVLCQLIGSKIFLSQLWVVHKECFQLQHPLPIFTLILFLWSPNLLGNCDAFLSYSCLKYFVWATFLIKLNDIMDLSTILEKSVFF